MKTYKSASYLVAIELSRLAEGTFSFILPMHAVGVAIATIVGLEIVYVVQTLTTFLVRFVCAVLFHVTHLFRWDAYGQMSTLELVQLTCDLKTLPVKDFFQKSFHGFFLHFSLSKAKKPSSL